MMDGPQAWLVENTKLSVIETDIITNSQESIKFYLKTHEVKQCH